MKKLPPQDFENPQTQFQYEQKKQDQQEVKIGIKMYLNEVYLGHSNGVIYTELNKQHELLENLPQSWDWWSAMIAGMISSPNNYSPIRHPKEPKKEEILDCFVWKKQVLSQKDRNVWEKITDKVEILQNSIQVLSHKLLVIFWWISRIWVTKQKYLFNNSSYMQRITKHCRLRTQ